MEIRVYFSPLNPKAHYQKRRVFICHLPSFWLPFLNGAILGLECLQSGWLSSLEPICPIILAFSIQFPR